MMQKNKAADPTQAQQAANFRVSHDFIKPPTSFPPCGMNLKLWQLATQVVGIRCLAQR